MGGAMRGSGPPPASAGRIAEAAGPQIRSDHRTRSLRACRRGNRTPVSYALSKAIAFMRKSPPQPRAPSSGDVAHIVRSNQQLIIAHARNLFKCGFYLSPEQQQASKFAIAQRHQQHRDLHRRKRSAAIYPALFRYRNPFAALTAGK